MSSRAERSPAPTAASSLPKIPRPVRRNPRNVFSAGAATSISNRPWTSPFWAAPQFVTSAKPGTKASALMTRTKRISPKSRAERARRKPLHVGKIESCSLKGRSSHDRRRARDSLRVFMKATMRDKNMSFLVQKDTHVDLNSDAWQTPTGEGGPILTSGVINTLKESRARRWS